MLLAPWEVDLMAHNILRGHLPMTVIAKIVNQCESSRSPAVIKSADYTPWNTCNTNTLDDVSLSAPQHEGVLSAR